MCESGWIQDHGRGETVGTACVSPLKSFCLCTGARASLSFLKSQNQLQVIYEEKCLLENIEKEPWEATRDVTPGLKPDLREREREGRLSRCLQNSSTDLRKAWQDHWRGVPGLQVMNLPLESTLLSLVMGSTASAPTSNGFQSSTYGAVGQLRPTTFEIWGHSHGHHSVQQKYT